MFEWPAPLQWHHAWKKHFGTFFNFGWLLFFPVCKQVWAILVKRLVIAKLGWKNYNPQPNTLETNLKFCKSFFSEPFFSTVSDIFQSCNCHTFWNRAWAVSNFLPNLVVFDFAWRFSAKFEWIFPKSKFCLI